MRYKKEIISLFSAIAVSVLLVAAVIAPNLKAEKVRNTENVPVFMYFVTDADMTAETHDVLTALEKEYGGRVKFDICNVDKTPALLKDFPVEDKTPALIMTDANSDVTDILYKTNDYEKLKNKIEAVLNDEN